MRTVASHEPWVPRCCQVCVPRGGEVCKPELPPTRRKRSLATTGVSSAGFMREEKSGGDAQFVER